MAVELSDALKNQLAMDFINEGGATSGLPLEELKGKIKKVAEKAGIPYADTEQFLGPLYCNLIRDKFRNDAIVLEYFIHLGGENG